MRNLGKRIQKLEASTNPTPDKKVEIMVKRSLEFLSTLDLKTINDLLLFQSEISWHRRKGNKNGEAEVRERIKRYCEGKEVKIVAEKGVGRIEDFHEEELPYTTTRNLNAPSFEDLDKHSSDFENNEELKRRYRKMILADFG